MGLLSDIFLCIYELVLHLLLALKTQEHCVGTSDAPWKPLMKVPQYIFTLLMLWCESKRKFRA